MSTPAAHTPAPRPDATALGWLAAAVLVLFCAATGALVALSLR